MVAASRGIFPIGVRVSGVNTVRLRGQRMPLSGLVTQFQESGDVPLRSLTVSWQDPGVVVGGRFPVGPPWC